MRRRPAGFGHFGRLAADGTHRPHADRERLDRAGKADRPVGRLAPRPVNCLPVGGSSSRFGGAWRVFGVN